jgi:cytochrome P450
LTLSCLDIYRNDRVTKSEAYLTIQPMPGVYTLFNAIDRRLHRSRRRFIGQGINDRAMREFEPTMIDQIKIFVKQLAESSQRRDTVDMTERCKHLGFDVVGHLGFGTALNLQTSDKNRFIYRGMRTSGYRSNIYIQFPFLKKLNLEYALYPFGLLSDQMKYYYAMREMILTRRSEPKDARKDLYAFIADIKDPETGKSLRLRDIWSEASFFMPAGKYIYYV